MLREKRAKLHLQEFAGPLAALVGWGLDAASLIDRELGERSALIGGEVGDALDTKVLFRV